jgi:glycosyltransferase involved in cell wall biosynthesis
MSVKSITKPHVSFIVPSFNESPHIIRESLQSVAQQSYINFECIVVDESTDPVSAQACKNICAEDNRFIYVKPKDRLGLAASLNLGLKMARADWVARFDSDDICLPVRLALQMAYLSNNQEVDVLGGGLEIIDEEGATIAFRDYPVDHDSIVRKMHFTTPFAHPTVIYRRELVRNAGGYDCGFRYAEDLDLWLRLLNKKARFANLHEPLVRYRQKCTQRQNKHWHFNLRARLHNFSFQMPLHRLAGIAAIASWSLIPSTVQEFMYKRIILHKG